MLLQDDDDEEEEEEEERQQPVPPTSARHGRQHNLLASDWRPSVAPAPITSTASSSTRPVPATLPAPTDDSDAPRSTLSRSSSSSSLATPAEDVPPRPQSFRRGKGALNLKFQQVDMVLRAARSAVENPTTVVV